MKSLYESILSSTKSGRFAKLTEEYLETLGFDTKPNIISKPGYPFYIYRYHGRFYVKIQRMFSDEGKHSIDTIRFYVDTIAEFEKGNRTDLIEKTQFEIDVLMNYLPEQLSTEEVIKIIEEIFEVVDYKFKNI